MRRPERLVQFWESSISDDEATTVIGRARRLAPLVLILPALSGCAGIQSTLDPAGKDARILADLFWFMLVGAVVLWLLVNGLFFYVTRMQPKKLSRRLAETLDTVS